MLHSLRSKQVSLVYVILAAIVFWLKPLFFETNVGFIHQSDYMPAFEFLSKWFPSGLFAKRLIALLLVLIQSFYLIRINTKYIFLADRGFMPAFMFVVISSVHISNLNLIPILFSNLFLLLAIDRLFSTYRKDRTVNGFFDIGLLLGIGICFYEYLIVYLFFFWLALLIMRPFYWREWFILIIGILIPFLYIFSYHFIAYSDYMYLFELFKQKISDGVINLALPSNFMWYCGFVVFCLLIAISNLLSYVTRKKVSVRKYFNVFLWMLVFGPAVYLLFPQAGMELLYIMAIPMSFIFANYFMNGRYNLGLKILFYLFVIDHLIYQYIDEIMVLVDSI